MSPALIHVVSRKRGDVLGWQVVRSYDGGLGPHVDVGPWWPTTKGAYQLCQTLETPYVSPLRVEASPAGADSPVPPSVVESASAEAASA